MMETIGEFCDRMGMDTPKMEGAATELEHARRAINVEIDALRAENARYRAALQEIERVAFRVTEGPDPDGDLVTYCQWCRMADRGRVQHRDWCAVTIAHRALHPEEGER